MAATNQLCLEKIISGGQCGADRAGLDAAKQLGLQTGGFAPKGFRTEEGAAPELAELYGIQETATTGYVQRTIANVDAADATVAFMMVANPSMGNGTRKTVGYCLHGKWCFPADSSEWQRIDAKHPVIVIDAGRWNIAPGRFDNECWHEDATQLREFLAKHNVRVLNVAGHCEFAEGTWGTAVRMFLENALRK